MRAYRPSGAISGGGFIRLLVIAILVGGIIGAILWAVDNYVHFYLVLLFPLLGGALAGAALGAGVRASKVRNPLFAGLVGIVAGLIMFGVYHFASYYVTFRNDVHSIYVERHPNADLTDAEFEDYLNTGLESEVGETGFVGYLKFAAQTGFTITNTSSVSSDNPIEIQGDAAFIYWGVEILLAALIAAVMAWNAAREPFDENMNQWYGPPMVVAIATTKSRKALMRALKDGSFEEAGGLLTKQQMKYPHLEIWTRRSRDSMDADVMLMVKHCQRQGRASSIKNGMVSASEFAMLTKAIDAAVAPNPVVSKI